MADVIEIGAEVRERELRLTSIPMMPSGSRNHLQIRVAFDAEWDGTTKTLVAYRDLSHPYHAPLGLDGTALIPHEVLAEQGVVYLGVFGVAGDQRVTSTIVRYGVNEGALTEGLQPSDPTPEMWDQLISAVNEVRQAAESAMRDAQTAAQSAQQSEQAAAGSATQADGAATRAETAAGVAETAKTDAQTAQRAAAQSAADAQQSASRAEQAAGNLSTAVTQAQDAAQAAQQSATQAQETARSAGDSAASAAQAQQGATDAETAARQSAAQAQSAQETATQAATEAGESARQAAGAQTAAQNSARSAGEQANAAATSAQQAKQSQTAAAESAISAQASADEATKQATAAEGAAVRAESAATEVEQSAQQIAGAIDRLAIHETAAGNPAVIWDSADWQMEGLRVYGQSEQVTTRGVNIARVDDQLKKVDLGAWENTTKRVLKPGEYACGLTTNNYFSASMVTDLVLSDGVIRFKTKGTGYGVGIGVSLIEGEQYTPSCKSKSGRISVIFYREDGTYISNSDLGQSFVVPSGARYSILLISDDNGVADLEQIQLETGAPATAYEPYTGGKPSPSPEYPQEIVSKTVDQIVVTGSNLLPLDDYIETATNKYFCKNTGLLLRAGVKYVFSCDGGPTNLYVNNKTTGETVVKAYNKSEAPYTPSEDGLYYFMVYHENGVSGFNNFRLNVGLKMPYEPYHAQTVTLSAPVTLRGVPVKTGGNVTINGQMYAADRIVERDGTVGVERWTKRLELPVADMNNSESSPGWNRKGFTENLSNPVYSVSTHLPKNAISLNFKYDILFFHTSGLTQSEWKSKHPDVVIGAVVTLEAPSFEPLPEPDQQAIRALRTYHGNTVVTTGAWTETDYVADPKLYIDGKVNALVTAYMQSIPVTIPLLDKEVVENER